MAGVKNAEHPPQTFVFDSDSDDLPEVPFMLPELESGATVTSSTLTRKTVGKRTSTRSVVAGTASLKEHRLNGIRLKRAQRLERAAEKAKHSEYLAQKYPLFSYDEGTWVTPKVWYFRGPNAEFVGCDSHGQFTSNEPVTLNEIVGRLQG